MDTTIRYARAGDIPAITWVLHSAFAPYRGLLGYRPSPMDRDYSGMIKENYVFVAEVRGCVVGVAISVPRERHLYLDAIAVAPSAQGRGLGRALLRSVEKLASELCYEHVRLHTVPVLNGPMRFYPSSGYVQSARSGDGPRGRVMFQKRIVSTLDIVLARMGVD